MTAENGVPLGARAENGARLARERLETSLSTTLPDAKLALREQAAVYARIAETFALRDVALANRELARSNDQLALSYDRFVDELMRRRGAPEVAD